MINLELLIVAVALGCDALSVAVGVGASGVTGRRIFRLSWHFGLFQFFMPLIGLAMGQMSAAVLGRAGHWLAAGCLGLIGLNMARQALRTPGEKIEGKDPTRGWTLVMLSFSTSVDALVAGFGLGLRGANVLIACLIIGFAAAVVTTAGMLIGAGAAKTLGRWVELFGGAVLIGLAVFFML